MTRRRATQPNPATWALVEADVRRAVEFYRLQQANQRRAFAAGGRASAVKARLASIETRGGRLRQSLACLQDVERHALEYHLQSLGHKRGLAIIENALEALCGAAANQIAVMKQPRGRPPRDWTLDRLDRQVREAVERHRFRATRYTEGALARALRYADTLIGKPDGDVRPRLRELVPPRTK